MSFSQFNLNTPIRRAIESCGYSKPTPIQERSIPSILKGQDLVASAPTGTGKTAAFVLPILHKLSEQKARKTRALILTPTRELASQITKATHTYGKFLHFNVANLVGGMPYHQQIKDLARGPDVIVATPGRLLDHLNSKRVDLSQIEILVLDEADRMLDMGFIDDVGKIAQLTPTQRQTLLFSATIDKQLQSVIHKLLKNPCRINLSTETISSPQIEQYLYRVKNIQDKSRLLKQILGEANIYKAIIFSATKSNADKLADLLRDQGFLAAALHGDLRQNVRNRTVDQLRRGKIQFLVATDVAARGIDISDITHVINYDLPRFCEDYVHRIGRTGRAGKHGMAISFISAADAPHLQRIERFIGQRIKMLHAVDKEQLSAQQTTISNEKVSFADKPSFANEASRPKGKKKPHRKFAGLNSETTDKTSSKRHKPAHRKEEKKRFTKDRSSRKHAEERTSFAKQKRKSSHRFRNDAQGAKQRSSFNA